MTILDDIMRYKREVELPRRMVQLPQQNLEFQLRSAPSPRNFVACLRAAQRIALIAEVKKASPSKGLLCKDFDAVQLADCYARNGAVAISVLTDEHFFQGSLVHLEHIRRHLDRLGLCVPVLRKDFIVDPYQVYEARAMGADAILLIAALEDALLAELLALTRELGMEALVEVHNRAELERVLPLGLRLVGVNNRDLRDFSVRLETCLELRPLVPEGVTVVAESGIRTRADVDRLVAAGIDAMLVGEALVTVPDVGAKVRELVNES